MRLNQKERQLIERYLSFYVELDSGKRTPNTADQKRFVKVCKGLVQPETEHEKAYIKYKQTGANPAIDIRMMGCIKTQLKVEESTKQKFKDKSTQRKYTPRHAPRRTKKIRVKSRSISHKPSIARNAVKSRRSIDGKVALNQDLLNMLQKSRSTFINKSARDVPIRKPGRYKIPDHEEGHPDSKWFTTDDWKLMRKKRI